MKILQSLILGIIAALGALVAQQIVVIVIDLFTGSPSATSSDHILTNATLTLGLMLPIAVLIEEIAKYSVIATRVEQYTYGRATIVHACFVGLGFGLMEFSLAFYKESFATLLTHPEIFGILLIHITTAGIIGYMSALHPHHTLWRMIKIIFIVTLIHSGYNALILLQETIPTIVPLGLAAGMFCTLLLLISIINYRLAQE